MGDSPEKTFRQPPPRYLDSYTQITILLGGFFQQLGWAFLGFGMIFVLAFSPFKAWVFLAPALSITLVAAEVMRHM